MWVIRVVLHNTFNAQHCILFQPWRLPYFESSGHAEFRTFIYSFTWEDPEEDLRHLQLTAQDTVFAITSAGDNVLHYAINSKPRCIHAVDMNPWCVPTSTLMDCGAFLIIYIVSL